MDRLSSICQELFGFSVAFSVQKFYEEKEKITSNMVTKCREVWEKYRRTLVRTKKDILNELEIFIFHVSYYVARFVVALFMIFAFIIAMTVLVVLFVVYQFNSSFDFQKLFFSIPTVLVALAIIGVAFFFAVNVIEYLVQRLNKRLPVERGEVSETEENGEGTPLNRPRTQDRTTTDNVPRALRPDIGDARENEQNLDGGNQQAVPRVEDNAPNDIQDVVPDVEFAVQRVDHMKKLKEDLKLAAVNFSIAAISDPEEYWWPTVAWTIKKGKTIAEIRENRFVFAGVSATQSFLKCVDKNVLSNRGSTNWFALYIMDWGKMFASEFTSGRARFDERNALAPMPPAG